MFLDAIRRLFSKPSTSTSPEQPVAVPEKPVNKPEQHPVAAPEQPANKPEQHPVAAPEKQPVTASDQPMASPVDHLAPSPLAHLSGA